MRHGSLFSGIGGFDLAAQWMGWENVFQVDIDPFCQKVLEKNFPNVKRYGDIKEFNGTKYRGTIDVLTGGFPCQPFSTIGKRRGKNDARHLWPEMLRIIGEIQPPHIVGENVRGLLNWNKGVVFDEVYVDLETKGYEVAPFLLPACGLNAWHRRDRIWIVAYNSRFRCNIDKPKRQTVQRRECALRETNPSHSQEVNSNNNSTRLQRSEETRNIIFEKSRGGNFPPRLLQPVWKDIPNQSPICRGDDGIPNRVDRIKSLGNAIVPQVAFEIFKAIELCNDQQRAF